MTSLTFLLIMSFAATPLGPGDYQRTVQIGETARPYLVHIPAKCDLRKPTPVVLNLHGAWTDASTQVRFSGLNEKADAAGFIVVYPNGSGAGTTLFWNSGLLRLDPSAKQPDDVAYLARVLDDLETVVPVDKKRVFATGMSNGGMMCYRLAAELSDRIAAIAPVGGTMSIDTVSLKRPVPVIHFHGTADRFVPYRGPADNTARMFHMKSVDDTMKTWSQAIGCTGDAKVETLPDTAHDGTTVTRAVRGPGKAGAEVVLYTIENGGHTWPGRTPIVAFLGKSTKNISANDLLWAFFQKHPLP